MILRNIFIGILLFCFFSSRVCAQTYVLQKDTNLLEHLRGESGIDPIIIHSKVTFTSFINNPKGPSGLITNTANITLAAKNWSIGLDGSLVTILSGNPGEGFHSASGDMKFTLSNKIYRKGKHAVSVSGKLAFPTGKVGYGSQYFSLTPVVTYTYSPKHSLILAFQPQYTFHLLKDPLYPKLSLLTLRALFAKFTHTGYAYGIEVKPNINFTSNSFELFISPFVSRSLGLGFNALILCDIPIGNNASNKGSTLQLGINRNF